MEERLSSENTAGIVVDTTSHIIDEIDELLEDFIEPEIMRLPQALEAMKRARDDIEKARASITAAHDGVDWFELIAFGQKVKVVCPCAPGDLIEAFNDTIAEASTMPDGGPKSSVLSELQYARWGITQAQQHHDDQDTAMVHLRGAMHSINDARQAIGRETLTSVICEDLPEITATTPEERLKQIQSRKKGVMGRIAQFHVEYWNGLVDELKKLDKEEEAAVMEARIICHDYSHL